MWLLGLSVLGIVALVLVLYIVLRTKHSDEAVWAELVPEETPADPPSDSTVARRSEENHGAETADDNGKTGEGELSVSIPVDNARTVSGTDARRSTRIDQTVPLVILGTNKRGQSFLEETSAVSLNLHGCRYPSRHEYPVESWVTLQVMGTEGRVNSPVVRAKVQSVFSPQTPRELCQVGVEFETPGNVWGINTPPEDWQRLSPRISSSVEGASVREPVTIPRPAVTAGSLEPVEMVEVMDVPLADRSPRHDGTRQETPCGEGGVVLMSDQLLSALEGPLQQIAEKVVQTAVAAQLDEVTRAAIARFDDAWKDHVRRTEELSAARLGEVQARSDGQWSLYRNRAEQIARRLELVVASTRISLAKIQKFAERVTHELEPQMYARLNESFSSATRELENAAARVADIQLVRLMEEKQRITREASLEIVAAATEARAVLHKASNSTLEEFRRQTEVQIDLAISEAMQGITSSLAALEAENRSACDARRLMLEKDVARTGEQSTQEFRKGIKAFLYSCFVAVSAADEHAQATRDGLPRNQGKLPREIAAPSNVAEKREQTDEVP